MITRKQRRRIKWWNTKHRFILWFQASRDYLRIRRHFSREFTRRSAFQAIYHMNIRGRIPMILKPQPGWGPKPVSVFTRKQG